MSNNLQQVVDEALALDVESRGILIDRVMLSLAHDQPAFLDEWLEESERRFVAFERSEEAAVDMNDAIEELRQRLYR